MPDLLTPTATVDPLVRLRAIRARLADLSREITELTAERDALLRVGAATYRPGVLLDAAGVSRSRFYVITGSRQDDTSTSP